MRYLQKFLSCGPEVPPGRELTVKSCWRVEIGGSTMRKSRPQSRPEAPWSKRRQIPDRQVVGAADQYEEACRLLPQSPGSGVVLPLMNLAAVSIELYLKSLSAERIYRAHPTMSDVSVVAACASVAGHLLKPLFEAISDDVRTKLIEAYNAKPRFNEDFLVALERLDGAFSVSRYPFEPDMNVSRYDSQSLVCMAEFLREFVHALPPTEMIELFLANGGSPRAT
jgi:hypothetical protein